MKDSQTVSMMVSIMVPLVLTRSLRGRFTLGHTPYHFTFILSVKIVPIHSICSSEIVMLCFESIRNFITRIVNALLPGISGLGCSCNNFPISSSLDRWIKHAMDKDCRGDQKHAGM